MKIKIILSAMIVFILVGTALAFFSVVRAEDSLVAAKSQFISGIKATQAYADHMGDLRVVYTIPWSVIASGGMGGTADGYTIHSTLGQPVAGGADEGDYSLTSGFWTEVFESIVEFFNFLPLIVR